MSFCETAKKSKGNIRFDSTVGLGMQLMNYILLIN